VKGCPILSEQDDWCDGMKLDDFAGKFGEVWEVGSAGGWEYRFAGGWEPD
jgi:hypothetical protein